MTLLFLDPLFQEHFTGAGHPESPERLATVVARLKSSGLVDRCAGLPTAPKPITETELMRVHSADVVNRVRAAANRGGGRIEADTVVSPRSFDVACAAAGACASAVDGVLTAQETTALCLVRPPGHHATPGQSMGFCLFNNIALAGRRALDTHGLTRVLIVDWDVHHGNGTQDIFYDDPAVTFLSIHRYGTGFYPGTGAASETGTGRGLGHTINTALPFGIQRTGYQDAFRHALETAARVARPELILLSAGFDAHIDDPVGGLCLEVEDFAWMTDALRDVAKVHCQGRLVSCLEGGYNLDVLADAVQLHLERLLA